MIRVVDSVHSRINDIGKCGQTKNDVIENLIEFYDRNSKSNNKNKMNVLLNTKRPGRDETNGYIGQPI